MSIKFVNDDILTLNVEAIVNPLDGLGSMLTGMPLLLDKKFPSNREDVVNAYKQGVIVKYEVFIHELKTKNNPKYIINMPIKSCWWAKSDILYIDRGLSDLQRRIQERDIKSVAIPPLGCGLGQLKYEEFKNLVLERLTKIPEVDILVIKSKYLP